MDECIDLCSSQSSDEEELLLPVKSSSYSTINNKSSYNTTNSNKVAVNANKQVPSSLKASSSTTNSNNKQTSSSTSTKPVDNLNPNQPNEVQLVLGPRKTPAHSVQLNNLSDKQYCCVWGVEVIEDAPQKDIARSLLAKVARHVNPILRERGWRVKRLIESTSRTCAGVCHGNGRNDADACSVNIQLNVRQVPDKNCTEFRSFNSLLAVMLHEITHIRIGLEGRFDIY